MSMPTYFCILPRLISLNNMADELQQTQTPAGPTRPPQSQQPREGGRQQNDRGRRHQGGQRHHIRRDTPQRPLQESTKPADAPEKEEGAEGEEETENDRSSSRQRHHRGGRPPKRIIEEWANDIYCE
jgi:hypothetical protein